MAKAFKATGAVRKALHNRGIRSERIWTNKKVDPKKRDVKCYGPNDKARAETLIKDVKRDMAEQGVVVTDARVVEYSVYGLYSSIHFDVLL